MRTSFWKDPKLQAVRLNRTEKITGTRGHMVLVMWRGWGGGGPLAGWDPGVLDLALLPKPQARAKSVLHPHRRH